MTKLALYRAYRPVDFADVIGQKHVTDTLDKAFVRGMISHAYLLTGPRGVGKTSVARIIARRVNDLSPEADITRELDILEIDAASNRGIDEIRAVRDKLTTTPAQLKYKVFIIDEVHMLTREAFNALLKTLEEPPPHVIFVLATTEVHKLPDTIVSRTQRHDFRLITTQDLVNSLTEVAQAESITIDESGLQLIAERAQGGFRDALSLLDQLASRGEPITGEIVAAAAGIGSVDQALEMVCLALQGKLAAAQEQLNAVLASGAEPTILTEFLLSSLRGAFVHPGSSEQLSVLDANQLGRALSELSQAMSEQRTTPIPSLPLELALWRLAGSSLQSAAPSHLSVASEAPTVKPAEAARHARPSTTQPAQPTQSAQSTTGLNDSVITTKALSLIKTKNNSLFAVLRSGEPSLTDGQLVILCRFRFHKERIEEARNRQLIETIFSKVAGRPIEMRVKQMDESTQGASTNDSSEELVASALEILGGEVIE